MYRPVTVDGVHEEVSLQPKFKFVSSLIEPNTTLNAFTLTLESIQELCSASASLT